MDLTELIASTNLNKSEAAPYLEAGYELSFRTSPRWRGRAVTNQRENVWLTIPHPMDILIAELNRLDPKGMLAFQRVVALTGHPTSSELLSELQNAVDLFRPAFDESSPNRYAENTRRLWRELFGMDLDVRKEIIEPAVARRAQTYREPSIDYKRSLGR